MDSSTDNRATFGAALAGAHSFPHSPLRSDLRRSHDRSFHVSRASLGRLGRRGPGPVGVSGAQPRGAHPEAGATFGKTFQQSINRNVDLLFLIDDSSSMRLSQANLRANFPTFMHALGACPAACPTSTSASSRPTWARATARSRAATATGGKNGIFQYTARGDLHGDRPAGGRDVHLGRRRRQATTPATSRTCSPASPRSARRAAASSTSSRRSRARSAPTAWRRARRERGLPAPRRATWRSS